MTGRRRLLLYLCLAVAFTLLLFLFLLARNAIRQARWRTEHARRGSRLTQIASAVKAYYYEHGSLPPAFVADDEGKRIHSWRVLIRDGFERGALSDYDFDSAWDSKHNRRLWSSPVRRWYFYTEKNWNEDPRETTQFVAVVAEDTLWPGEKPFAFDDSPPDDLRDEYGGTILLIEIPNSDIHWMEPRDITFEEARRLFLAEHEAHSKGKAKHLLYVNVSGKPASLLSIPNVETFTQMLRANQSRP